MKILSLCIYTYIINAICSCARITSIQNDTEENINRLEKSLQDIHIKSLCLKNSITPPFLPASSPLFRSSSLTRNVTFLNSTLFCALFFYVVLYKRYFVTGRETRQHFYPKMRWTRDRRRRRKSQGILSLIDKRNAVNASSKHLGRYHDRVIYLSRGTRINFRAGIDDWCWKSHALTASCRAISRTYSTYYFAKYRYVCFVTLTR